jgi:hypothetical protein
MEESNGWKGQFDVFIKQNDQWIHDKTINNTITDNGLNFFRDALRGIVTDAQLKYIAVGTSSTAVTTSDSQLGNEVFRKQIFSRTAGTTGQCISIAILEDTEANYSIAEIGVFAGTTASAIANSGIMVSRVLYSRVKTNLESIQIQRTDTIGRA